MSEARNLESPPTSRAAESGLLDGSPVDLSYGAPFDEYSALVSGCGVADLGERTQLEVLGKDRALFLHNLCTQEIRRRKSREGCEAFFLDVQGRILFHACLFVSLDSIAIESAAGMAGPLTAHLDRYLIREDVRIEDRSSDWGQLYCGGPGAAAVLAAAGASQLPQGSLEHAWIDLEGHSVSLRARALTDQPGYCLVGPRAAMPVLRQRLLACGARLVGRAALEAARIEALVPFLHQDFPEKTLPQEVGRDAACICFTKGCYLGQETVARIDALGHVNRHLAGIVFMGADVPPPATEVLAAGSMVGRVVSSAFSPPRGTAVGLAYLKRGHHAQETVLESRLGPCRVFRSSVDPR
jgi:folate-binding protein YgfZ